jgi:hypothetical protein
MQQKMKDTASSHAPQQGMADNDCVRKASTSVVSFATYTISYSSEI